MVFCSNCGEAIDREYNKETHCENCDKKVKTVEESSNSEMPFEALHPIHCTECEEPVRLVGLHRGEYTDGVLAACGCFSLSSIPDELGEAELPSQWRITHSKIFRE